jgi:hypothetical protein
MEFHVSIPKPRLIPGAIIAVLIIVGQQLAWGIGTDFLRPYLTDAGTAIQDFLEWPFSPAFLTIFALTAWWTAWRQWGEMQSASSGRKQEVNQWVVRRLEEDSWNLSGSLHMEGDRQNGHITIDLGADGAPAIFSISRTSTALFTRWN